MLIVLLILLTATALATTSLQTTQFELRSAGYNRAAVQMQYVSEAAAMNTIAWVDATALDGSFLTRQLRPWKEAKVAPTMALFGEPEVPTDNLALANRTVWSQQSALTTLTLPPITNAGYAQGNFTDPIGTLGPRSTYQAGAPMNDNTTEYVVDLYDCRQLPNTASVGFQVNQGGSGTIPSFQWYCVVTSRGRAFVPDPGGSKVTPTKAWTLVGGAANGYVVNRFTMAHDSRGTIITPPIIGSP
jgi:hypothetical protein